MTVNNIRVSFFTSN